MHGRLTKMSELKLKWTKFCTKKHNLISSSTYGQSSSQLKYGIGLLKHRSNETFSQYGQTLTCIDSIFLHLSNDQASKAKLNSSRNFKLNIMLAYISRRFLAPRGEVLRLEYVETGEFGFRLGLDNFSYPPTFSQCLNAPPLHSLVSIRQTPWPVI